MTTKARVTLTLTMLLAAGCGHSSFDAVDSVPSTNSSTLTVSQTNWADGVTPAQVWITLKDAVGNPLPGISMGITVTGHDNTTSTCGVSNSAGIAVCSFYSTYAESKMVKTVGAIALTQPIVFNDRSPMKAIMGVTSGGGKQSASNGQIVMASVGVMESPTVLRDFSGQMRAQTSILVNY